jgi:hypothetical protein
LAVRIALDAHRYSDLCPGEAVVADLVVRAEEVFVPFVVVGDLCIPQLVLA